MKRIAELLDDENTRYAPLLSFALRTAWAIIATLLVTSVFWGPWSPSGTNPAVKG
jgi:hypothetical protein